ncbi:MAG: hypothetical protein D6834_03315 [Aquificota bacterium]|nr:MAG: hypothetical protein D6834_03315 [Aquificota bacterium]
MKNTTKIKIEKAYKEGKLWKVKEILEGNIRSQPYDKEIYEEYGKLLYQLGDLKNAGKYLLLSGNTEDKYKDAINIFLNSYKPHQWWSQFPRSFKRDLFYDDMPQTVKMLINEYPEFKESILKNTSEPNSVEHFEGNRLENYLGIIGGILLFFLFTIFILGLWKFVEIVSLVIKRIL